MHEARMMRSSSHPVFSIEVNGTCHSLIFLYIAPIMIMPRPIAASCVRNPKSIARPPAVSATPMNVMKFPIAPFSFFGPWTRKIAVIVEHIEHRKGGEKQSGILPLVHRFDYRNIDALTPLSLTYYCRLLGSIRMILSSVTAASPRPSVLLVVR